MIVLMVTDLPVPVAPGDQQMRHLGQVGDDRLPLEVVSQRDRQRSPAALPIRRLEQLPQSHDPGGGVRDLHPYRALPRDRRDTNRRNSHRNGEVVRQGADAPSLYARGRDHLELRHHRAGGSKARPPFHLERPQRLDQRLPEPVELCFTRVDVLLRGGREEVDRRQVRLFVDDSRRTGLGRRLLLLLADLRDRSRGRTAA